MPSFLAWSVPALNHIHNQFQDNFLTNILREAWLRPDQDWLPGTNSPSRQEAILGESTQLNGVIRQPPINREKNESASSLGDDYPGGRA
jgi:hypothetical protein